MQVLNSNSAWTCSQIVANMHSVSRFLGISLWVWLGFQQVFYTIITCFFHFSCKRNFLNHRILTDIILLFVINHKPPLSHNCSSPHNGQDYPDQNGCSLLHENTLRRATSWTTGSWRTSPPWRRPTRASGRGCKRGRRKRWVSFDQNPDEELTTCVLGCQWPHHLPRWGKVEAVSGGILINF